MEAWRQFCWSDRRRSVSRPHCVNKYRVVLTRGRQSRACPVTIVALPLAVGVTVMKYVNPEKLNVVVNELLPELSPSDFADAEEYRLSQKFTALPIGSGSFSYFLLHPDGEVISIDCLDSVEVERSRESYRLSTILAWGAERYPALALLIPERPPEAEDCPLCGGSGTDVSVAGDEMTCLWCSGLRWAVEEGKAKVTTGED